MNIVLSISYKYFSVDQLYISGAANSRIDNFVSLKSAYFFALSSRETYINKNCHSFDKHVGLMQ